MTAEDNTAIKCMVSYAQKSDQLLGFCGVKTADPKDQQCLLDLLVPVGDDHEACNRMIEAFDQYKIRNMACVIFLDPMHQDLPKVVLLQHLIDSLMKMCIGNGS